MAFEAAQRYKAPMPFGLSEPQWVALLRGLVRGEYHLLLGAGASMDSQNQHRDALPSARQLVDRLVADFAIPADPTTLSLPRAFDAAKSRTTVHGETLPYYLERAFTDCTPARWYEQVVSTRWRAIWTLNIDDVVTHAYTAEGWAIEQQPKVLSWIKPFARQEDAKNEVQIVHLHGSVSHLPEDGLEGLVFGIVEYLRAAEHRHAWHHVFSDEFQTEPYIIIGATLADEFDLGEILRRANHSLELTGRPSVIVLKSMDELQREEFRAWGLCPIEALASDFFSVLSADLREYEAEFAAATPGGSNLLPGEAVRFLRQFHQLRVERVTSADSRHDLYSGHEPTWHDVLANRDAVFGVSGAITSYLRRQLDAQAQQVVSVVTGFPFSGKSMTVLRVARELVRSGVDVFSFVGEQRVDVPAALWWLSNSGPTVLLFDGVADQSPELWDLARVCDAAGVSMIVLGAERSSRRNRLYSNLPPEVLRNHGLFEMRRLSDRDIRSLLNKLRQARRLGRISDLSRRDQEEHFRREGGRDLFEGMAQLEAGKGFVDRLSAQHESITDPALRTAYGIACIAYAFGYPVPIPILCSSAGISAESFVSAVRPDGPLGEVIQLLGSKARPRHRRLASLVVERVLSRQQLYDLSQALARNLGPYITRVTIAQRTLPHRIGRELMNHRILVDWIGAERVDDWYAELADVYDWNARYWEQRALAAARLGAFDRAESFAAHAVVLYRDSFTLTTLGTVLMRKAAGWLDPWSESSRDAYWRGVDALREAITRGDGRLELPYLTFFSYTLELGSNQLAGAAVRADADVQQQWNTWYADATHLALFRHVELQDQLARLQQKWLEVNVGDATGG